ncbi:MAG: cell division protein FtsZ [Candidatus Marinimicrobia bacterium]|nr:cell division protein FtsZ [Candidatus Neomarinimicrobiota bacterium]|tara:strand:+ start:3147 stop:4322 length:1176 start_codon:yes stop_codon:yes gene_type:complete
MHFEFETLADQRARIKVIGVGGAGGNAINRMITLGLSGVEFIAVNTDAQDLDNNRAETKIQIGKNLTKGLGAGAKADVGKIAMETEKDAVATIIDGADMIFVTAGMGGGTGTGAAPIIAQIARELNALTVGIATRPFNFEGPKRMNRANSGIEEMQRNCDTLISIPNQKLLSIADKSTTLTEAFQLADTILHQATRGISDLINVHGLINLDFADVDTIMRDMGDAIMGTGVAIGEERAVLAAQQAISSPLLDDVNMQGAQGVLVNITGGPDLTLMEADDASQIIFDEAGEEANIIFGAVIDPSLQEEIHVTVIATGFNAKGRTTEINDFNRDKTPIPTFKEVAEKIHETPNVPAYQSKEMNLDEKLKENPEPIIFKDDDLEIPAILRQRNQ